MYLCGPDSSQVLGVKPNNSLNGVPIVCPPAKSELDVANLTSFSIYSYHSIYITTEGIIKAIGSNKGNRIFEDLPNEITEYTEFQIKDSEGKIYHPISVVCGNEYSLYLVSDPSNGEKRHLVYSSVSNPDEKPIFLLIGHHNPVVIYGGEDHSAAIDSDGQILIVKGEFDSDTVLEEIPIVKLPHHERAISVACLKNKYIALASSGKVYISQNEEHQFALVKELEKVQITQISGVMLHCIAVSNDGRAFGFGSNNFGKLLLPKETKEVDKFTEIKAFGRSKIKAAFAGFQHSVFINFIGQLRSCGMNKQGQLFLDRLSDEAVTSPAETDVKEGVDFCIAGSFCSVAFSGNVPPSMPNKNTMVIRSMARAKQPLAAFPSLRAALKKT